MVDDGSRSDYSSIHDLFFTPLKAEEESSFKKSYCQLVKKLIQSMPFFRFNLLENYCKACKMRIFRSCNLSRITESSKLSNALSTRACSYYKGGFIYTFTFKFSSSIVFCLSELGSGSLSLIHTNMGAHSVIFWSQLCYIPHSDIQLKPLQNKKGPKRILGAPFSVSFSQLPAVKKGTENGAPRIWSFLFWNGFSRWKGKLKGVNETHLGPDSIVDTRYYRIDIIWQNG